MFVKRKNKEMKNEICKVVQGMMNEDAKKVKIAQTIGQNGAVNIGAPENDLVYYTNVVDPDDPNPNNPTMIIKAVTISISAAQRYSQSCLNQIINMYPAFNDYLGDHNGKKSLNIYVVLDDRIETMATDRRNIYINPLFLWKLAHKNIVGEGLDALKNTDSLEKWVKRYLELIESEVECGDIKDSEYKTLKTRLQYFLDYKGGMLAKAKLNSILTSHAAFPANAAKHYYADNLFSFLLCLITYYS